MQDALSTMISPRLATFFAQPITDLRTFTFNNFNNLQPVFLIDSIKVDDKFVRYIDVSAIKKITYDDSTYPSGTIYIKLNNHSYLKHLLNTATVSLNDIAKNNIQPDKPIYFELDNQLLSDTAGVRLLIKNLYYAYITGNDNRFKILPADALIVSISTKPPEYTIR
ncbi:MAG: hypothetical protein EOP47_30730 [Sphingobacteriaceae bacterium]|nr:MAG: hypothetical protein EOP47_30730 [Sphingobacteriaceae bacterium]